MIHVYVEEAWDKHIAELNDQLPVVFLGNELIQSPIIGPTPDELVWLRKTLLSLPAVEKVLDFGQGIGLMVGLFEGFDYTGADLTPAMIEEAQKRNPQHRFVRADGSKLLDTFSPGQFDLIFTRAVIQHNPEPTKSEIIQGFYNILRPGGYYLFHEHAFIWPAGKEEHVEYMKQRGFILKDYKAEFSYLFQKA